MSEQGETFPDKIDRIAKRLMGYKPRRDPRKEENPIFATFQDRAIASVLDVAVIFFLLQDVFEYITYKVFSFADAERLQRASDNAPDNPLVTEQIRYFVEASFESGLFELWLLNSLIQSIILGVIFIVMWHEWHCTLGKYIVGLEFAGRNGEGKPTTRQYLLRYLGYYLSLPPFMLGFAMLGLTRQKRALHDYIGGTTVIYSKRGSIFRQSWDWLKRWWKSRKT